MVLYLPRDAATVPVSRQVLDGCLATLGVTPDTRGDIALALTEACANVVLLAGPAEEYLVQVSARSGQCAIEVINADGGNGQPGPDGKRGRTAAGIAACAAAGRPARNGRAGLPWPMSPCR